MKQTVEYLRKNNLLFRSFRYISPKELGSRKKIEIYLGVDRESYYHTVISVQKKSRILRKEAAELMAFHARLEQFVSSSIKKKHLLIDAPLCAKAKLLMVDNGWKVYLL